MLRIHGIAIFATMRMPLIAVLTFLATVAAAETIDGNRIIILDGDTVALPKTAALPKGERIRLEGIDAPESFRPTCEKERIAGLKAKERLAGLVRGQAVEIEREGRDRYGRTLAELLVNGRSVGDVLLAEGYALKYRPGEKARRVAFWCRR